LTYTVHVGLLCCEMETCTDKGVSCFIHNSDKIQTVLLAISLHRHRSLTLIYYIVDAFVCCGLLFLTFTIFCAFMLTQLCFCSVFICAFMSNLRAAIKVIFALP